RPRLAPTETSPRLVHHRIAPGRQRKPPAPARRPAARPQDQEPSTIRSPRKPIGHSGTVQIPTAHHLPKSSPMGESKPNGRTDKAPSLRESKPESRPDHSPKRSASGRSHPDPRIQSSPAKRNSKHRRDLRGRRDRMPNHQNRQNAGYLRSEERRVGKECRSRVGE